MEGAYAEADTTKASYIVCTIAEFAEELSSHATKEGCENKLATAAHRGATKAEK